jgi:UDP-N-acetylglucosamine 2-epimerase (non-hydrolysing)
MIAILVGTRPELIKMAPVLRLLKQKRLPHIFVHSNQHYSEDMDAKIMKDLKLKKPDYHLRVGSGSHATQTGKIMEGVERICTDVHPDIVVVHGDTNTTLGGALTAKKLHIPVAHVEAGLRSFDYRMPEEINRTLVDRLSDILFAPTEGAKQNLLREGMLDSTIVVTGNTVVDAINQHITLAKSSHILEKLQLKSRQYILVTLHRAENVDSADKLKKLLKLLAHASQQLSRQLVWPIHPRTNDRLDEFKLTLPESVLKVPPVGYIDMLQLMKKATLILTDSGGIQEEAYVLKTPVMTLRDSTERPETLSANFIIDSSLKKFDNAWMKYQQNQVSWGKEFGNGTAAEKIVAALQRFV